MVDEYFNMFALSSTIHCEMRLPLSLMDEKTCTWHYDVDILTSDYIHWQHFDLTISIWIDNHSIELNRIRNIFLLISDFVIFSTNFLKIMIAMFFPFLWWRAPGHRSTVDFIWSINTIHFRQNIWFTSFSTNKCFGFECYELLQINFVKCKKTFKLK